MTRRPIAPARIAAYDVLRAVGTGAADLPHALAQARDGLTDERDRALAGEIATGALRWQGAFDHVIAAFTKRSIDQLDPEVVAILRGAIFQLLHLDRVPASAAVNDAVSLARRAGKSSAAPLVNAVLRRVSRERRRLPLPPPPDWGLTPMSGSGQLSDREHWGQTPVRGAALDYLSITLSHPRWLAERWLDAYGFEAAEAWMTFNNAPAPLTLRVNRLKTTTAALIESLTAHGVTVKSGRHSPDALLVTGGNPLLTPIADHGLYFVQDEASQLVASIVGASAGDRVLDACASPGGKTVAIAATMNDRGLVVAADVRGRRIDLLTRTVGRSGAVSIRIVQADAAALPFSSLNAAASFDWILLDAPCSGLGTIRRDPDIRWRRQPADLLRFRELQVAMLREAARVLKPGGHLVYATCSSEPEENEDVVAAAIADGTLRRAAPDRFPAHLASLVGPSGDFRSYPFRDGLEAFFAALLVK
jgi:16S rRNA (cytosine967-C5)-methyltransferase